ncbi:KUP/HAK/KT family potassium transporter [Streptomyces sp. R39]|uniref:KUP/HAK/KT family potassium transporter n=1 Tax=Streptomyces sp. R39 TaxID=3238631 RepID=A0AB39QKX7_9ACTN
MKRSDAAHHPRTAARAGANQPLGRPAPRPFRWAAGAAFFALVAIVLAVTGAEAPYAGMGHFGHRVIARAWLLLVFRACR